MKQKKKQKKLHVISPIPPSVNHYLAYRAIIKNGRPMAMSYKTPEALKYRKEFAELICDEVAKQGWDLPVNKTRHFYVDGIFYFDRIDRDANNYWKVLLDAITDTQLIWADDNVVCERVQAIYYDTSNPRIELDIYPTDYIGVFKDASQLEQFESRCADCAKYKRNCSLLKKAKEGKIQADIVGGACLKFKEGKDNINE